jgi:hypothetical protein
VSVLGIRNARYRAGIPIASLLLLELPEAQPIIKRIGENIPASYPRRMDQVLHIAAVAVAAKKNPCNPYAGATL